LAHILNEKSPDIILLSEVGGLQSLEAFNQYFLNNAYLPMSPPSNSNRGIDLGILFKKTLPYPHTITNHLNFLKNGAKKDFNRNVLDLQLEINSSLSISLFIVHLKSKLDFERKDFWGLKARTDEVLGLVDILKKEKNPFIVAGDFNGNASLYNTDNEFLPLYSPTNKFQMKDLLEILELPIEERATHHYFKSGYRRSTQLDYLFLSQDLWSKVDPEHSYPIKYLGDYGEKIDPPATLGEKQKFPSDHNPLMVSLNL
jgi:endonuclease/exonuclease/phosphatase family metal-dependent hydrolase